MRGSTTHTPLSARVATVRSLVMALPRCSSNTAGTVEDGIRRRFVRRLAGVVARDPDRGVSARQPTRTARSAQLAPGAALLIRLVAWPAIPSISAPTPARCRRPRPPRRRGSTAACCGATASTTRRRCAASSGPWSTIPGARSPTGASPTPPARTTTRTGTPSTPSTCTRRCGVRTLPSPPRARPQRARPTSSATWSTRWPSASPGPSRSRTSRRGSSPTPTRWPASTRATPTTSTSPRCTPTR